MSPSAPEPGPGAHPAVDQLVQVGDDLQREFRDHQRVLSFEAFFRLVAERPTLLLRDSARYLHDTFDYFGSDEVRTPRGPARRFRLFDCAFADGRDRLSGHEDVQNHIYRILGSFVRQGRPNKLILLHGPNGSAKSTCVAAIARALEHYSRTDAGALYRFNWVFPSGKTGRAGIGFRGGVNGERLASYANLPEELIDARLTDELRDDPLLLIPRARRVPLLEGLLEAAGDRRPVPDSLRYGELSHRNREIFEALLSLYHGDWHAVLRHVQVERFFLSRRYRTGLIVVEPKLSVDAHTHQITRDRSLEALPPALQTLALFRYTGELVDANRGIIEFEDLLKRPVEAFKYLMSTVELGRAGLEDAILYLDEVFIGSTNDVQLLQLREIPDFLSFKGRIELVRVGYLLDVGAEARIYQGQFTDPALHVAPHALELAALWAVLMRLQRPQARSFPDAVRPLVEKLTALEKALWYARDELPEGVDGETARALRGAARTLVEENDEGDTYEGHEGPSPREVRMALFNASQDPRFGFLSPLAVLDELEALGRRKDVYPYLRREPRPGGYADPRWILQAVREHYHERLHGDLWTAVGLVPGVKLDHMIARYVDHVAHWVKQERMKSAITGAEVEPDEALMAEVERYLGVTDGKTFRRDAIARIASWAMAHPGLHPPDLEAIFAKERREIERGIQRDRQKPFRQALEDLLALLREQTDALSADRRNAAATALDHLVSTLGYRRESAQEAVTLYLQTLAK
jgi:predicted Ser/Thr protein kinase